ncbi:MAG: hypothetical protein CMF71_09060 [Magnetovibrio sp.]|nr:hypothetical protein [Magnetovibrio sp.]MBH90356.1 hypothetical protein [Magnetovibrio sp.]
MARHKEFDKIAILEKAIGVFWSKGFEATTIQDLVNATRINRGSIYDTFGNKARLFNLALTHYQKATPTQKLLNNAKTANPRKEIEDYFHRILYLHGEQGEKRGCLITNSIAELAYLDKKLAAHFKIYINNSENALYTLVKRGQETGDINPWRNPRSLARSLLASAEGLILISKVDPGNETLLDIANAALSLLD